jgi:hypothetical protein
MTESPANAPGLFETQKSPGHRRQSDDPPKIAQTIVSGATEDGRRWNTLPAACLPLMNDEPDGTPGKKPPERFVTERSAGPDLKARKARRQRGTPRRGHVINTSEPSSLVLRQIALAFFVPSVTPSTVINKTRTRGTLNFDSEFPYYGWISRGELMTESEIYRKYADESVVWL